jgi:hypothetical protein
MSRSQPPITPGCGISSTDWLPGPEDDAGASVLVSYTDFRAESEPELQEVFEAGLRLSESWPIMRGAIGIWLWAKPGELRGGSVSVWREHDDLRRFVRWPVHVAIMHAWRERIEVLSEFWHDQRFVADRAWARAEVLMRARRERHATPAAQA